MAKQNKKHNSKSKTDKQIQNSMEMFDLMPSSLNMNPLSSQAQIIQNNNYALVSINRNMLSYAYNTYGILQTVIDQPVEDAFRGGVELSCSQLDADELQTLKDYVDKNHYLEKLKTAIKWQRLFGGGALIINTDQDPTTELDISQINESTPLEFISADRWECLYSYAIEKTTDTPFNYYGQPIHKSRVLQLIGKEAPSYIRKQLQGWGLSEVERIMRPLNQFIKNENVVYELLDEAKIDVYKIKGLNASMAKSGVAQKINDRIGIANQQKSFLQGIAMDSEDDYIQKQMTFSGLGEMLTQLRIGIASACKMPLTKLFGLSSAGFNSGDDDIENYNCLVESEIRTKSKSHVVTIYQLSAQKLFRILPDIKVDFKPLRILTAEAEQNIKNAKFDRINVLYDKGLLDEQEYYEALKTEEIMHVQSKVGEGKSSPIVRTPEQLAVAGATASKIR
jgi:phage-related protein (TIGR01555 family)